MAMHSLLARQIKRHLSDADLAVEPCRSFLAAIDDAYRGFDADREMVERSMELSSSELLDASSELRAIVQAFPDVMLHVDETGLVVASRGRGYRPRWADTHVLGRRLPDLLPVEFAAALTEGLRRTIDTGVAEMLEFVEAHEGQEVVDEIRLAPLGPTGAIVLVRDITEQRRTAALRLAKEAAEAESLAKGAFLANMSHELRTPLNAIVGYAEMLGEDAATTGPQTLVDDLGRIVTAGRHLMKIVNDVLDIAKIEAGRLSVDVQKVDIDALIADVMAAVRSIASANQNHVVAAVMPGLPVFSTDPTKLRQVLINLMANACKFTHAGSVEVDVRLVESAGCSEIAFAVRDTGIGIAPDELPQLFQDFRQVDSSNTRRYGGTGLGLSISRRLCNLLGGDISVESQLGKGSVFTVWLPVGVETPARHARPAESAALEGTN